MGSNLPLHLQFHYFFHVVDGETASGVVGCYPFQFDESLRHMMRYNSLRHPVPLKKSKNPIRPPLTMRLMAMHFPICTHATVADEWDCLAKLNLQGFQCLEVVG